MNEALWFVFHWVSHIMEWSHQSEREAIQSVIRLGNVVILRHNDAVNKVRRGDFRIYWHDTQDYSDNQCVFSSLLDRDTIYKTFDERPWFDVVSARNMERWKHAQRGSALSGYAAGLMLVLIVVLFCYWFGTAMFSVTVNFSDIISGIF